MMFYVVLSIFVFIFIFIFVISASVSASAGVGWAVIGFLVILGRVFIVLVAVSGGMGFFTLFIIGVKVIMSGLLVLGIELVFLKVSIMRGSRVVIRVLVLD